MTIFIGWAGFRLTMDGNYSRLCGREAAAETPPTIIVRLLPDIGSADQFAHACEFRTHDRGQLLRRAADHIEAELGQPRPYGWIFQGRNGGGVEPDDDLRRGVRGHQQRAPGHEAETRNRFG